MGSQIAADQRQITQQGREIAQLQQQIAALQTQTRASASAPAAPVGVPKNGCDRGILRDATLAGGEHFAAGEFQKALGYYSDAVTACPTDARAQLNLARAYEAMGERGQAVAHYKLAVERAGAAGGKVASQAGDALKRLGAGG